MRFFFVKCKKGKKRIRTTNRALKKQHASSLQFANEARARKRAKLEGSPSFVTDTPLLSPEVSTITMSGSSTGTISTGDSHDAQTKESTRTRQTIGMSGNHFIDDRSRDWRSFGKQTMKDWVESGFINRMWERLYKAIFESCSSTNQQKMLVVSEELPLSPKGCVEMLKKANCVQIFLRTMLNKYTDGEAISVVNISKEVVKIQPNIWEQSVLNWVLNFIHNIGKFKNVAYKRRPPVGVLQDSNAREQMTLWMVNASRANPPVYPIPTR